jgi:hypothetical protein
VKGVVIFLGSLFLSGKSVAQEVISWDSEFVPGRGDLAHQLKLLYDEVESEREAMEMRYDKETRHSMNADRQAYWNVWIGKELKALEKFAE